MHCRRAALILFTRIGGRTKANTRSRAWGTPPRQLRHRKAWVGKAASTAGFVCGATPQLKVLFKNEMCSRNHSCCNGPPCARAWPTHCEAQRLSCTARNGVQSVAGSTRWLPPLGERQVHTHTASPTAASKRCVSQTSTGKQTPSCAAPPARPNGGAHLLPRPRCPGLEGGGTSRRPSCPPPDGPDGIDYSFRLLPGPDHMGLSEALARAHRTAHSPCHTHACNK